MKTMSLTAAVLFGSALSIVPVSAGSMPALPAAPIAAGKAGVVPTAFGDLPVSGGRRRGRRQQRDGKPSAPPEARKEPQGESPEQHKAYLKRYGF